jgi:hypothetical protein
MARRGRALGQREKLAAEDHDGYERGCEQARRSLEEGALQMAVSSSGHSARELLTSDDESPEWREMLMERERETVQVAPKEENEELELPI